MLIQENISLAEFTSFKIGGPARFFCRVSDEDELVEAVRFAQAKKLPLFVLGGGSNILISDKGFAGLVVKMEIKGIEEKEPRTKNQEPNKFQSSKSKLQIKSKVQSPNSRPGAPDGLQSSRVHISVGAGESWDGFVDWTVERGFYGLENLSAIPGTVGAAPVQNIGAYGAEAAHAVSSVRALDTTTMKFVELSKADCGFDYRDSLFKRERGRYVIARVDFHLTKNGKINIDYKDLKDYFARSSMTAIDPTLKQVRSAVIAVRSGKLPDWKLWGTAGSFFKNPIISADRFKELKEKYPDLPGFPETNDSPDNEDGRVKVSLAWILDKVCDVKGLQMGKARVYEKQALVLVAMPGASAEEVVGLSHELMRRVKDRTGLDIECEVEWVN